jgi:hypothetical protein|uniref:Uncharacterized protein n=1 Tax=Thorea hispida TaxID=202687 RepID=A0A1C9CAN6_9FLOR|nr:hypothetical protein Thor_137 [Thorea hispida]AOM65429.1 hypothetical protein Thor_137 [Thorea hispida]ARX95798.1 hypothetical protein [Thorea hispida]UNJ79088.1 hypothetical protein [Thorea hispida]
MNNYKLKAINTNTEVKTFIQKNLYLILLSIYTINTYNNILQFKEQTFINNLYYIKYKRGNIYTKHKLLVKNHYDTIALAYILINILVQKNLQTQVNYILKAILNNHDNTYIDSNKTKNYIKKFHYSYIKNTNSYKIGHTLYKNKKFTKTLSITSLIIISQTYTRYGIIYLLLYLIC